MNSSCHPERSEESFHCFFLFDQKETKNQGCTEFAKNQIFGLEIKELAALKQLLFLSILQIDFFNANSLRPKNVLGNGSAWLTMATHRTKPNTVVLLFPRHCEPNSLLGVAISCLTCHPDLYRFYIGSRGISLTNPTHILASARRRRALTFPLMER